MMVSFGKHAGKSVELLLLKNPDYVEWVLGQANASLPMLRLQQELRRLIAIFDRKPFLKRCYGQCGSRATRCSVYRRNVTNPYWWCDICDPYDAGAVHASLQEVRDYGDALAHVRLFCDGSKESCRALVRDLALAKGLPARCGERQAVAFFTGTEEAAGG